MSLNLPELAAMELKGLSPGVSKSNVHFQKIFQATSRNGWMGGTGLKQGDQDQG